MSKLTEYLILVIIGTSMFIGFNLLGETLRLFDAVTITVMLRLTLDQVTMNRELNKLKEN